MYTVINKADEIIAAERARRATLESGERTIGFAECDEHPAVCDCSWHENARHAAATHAEDLTHEEIFEALDRWLGAPHTYREFKVRPILHGRVCVLTDGGRQITERGKHTDDAIENALREAGAL